MHPPAPRMHDESITQNGWTVHARKAPIIGSPLLEQYSEQLGNVLTLPEILFGNSSLQLRHDASGVVLSFSALDALKQWRTDNLPPLKVAVAKEWQAARQQEIEKQQAVVLDYDWTFSTSYAGTLGYTSAAGSSTAGAGHAGGSTAVQLSTNGGADAVDGELGPGQQTAAPAATQSQTLADGPSSRRAVGDETQHAMSVDATATAATGSISNQAASASASLQHQQQQQQHHHHHHQQQLPSWQPTSRQIDRQMLMSKNEPILFYAEVPLYESELDDNGVCQLTVKVRVMPRCWLVLLRFWLRVDGCLVRLREVRHFCRLDTPEPVIIRETKFSEGTMQQLAAAGAPTSVSGYEDADAATSVFSAIAPQCLQKFELHELQLPCSAVSSSVS